jgi:tRNA 2-selenouridine synthase
MHFKVANVSQLTGFDEIIDVRSPAEFAEDHIPGAINCPVLDDEERIRVGTLYKQDSPFAARKVGAALVAKNIARHIEELFHDRPKSWKPLIYCWRGGQRSGAMAIVFTQIGWNSFQLEGGYKAYRRQVLEELATRPAAFHFRVLCGPTGSGKSRLLAALEAAGHQVLDLERLASHRGSVLGLLPRQPQPSQKSFDSALVVQLRQLDPARPVYIEAESKKIGQIALPDALFQTMHQGECLRLEVPLAERVRFLLEDYDFYVAEPERLLLQLGFLKNLHSRVQLDSWAQRVRDGQFAQLVQELLEQHYDPLYHRSQHHHFRNLAQALDIRLPNLSPDVLATTAHALPG